jgi:hypothetical protein
MARKKAEGPIDAVQFNILAVVLALLILPGAVAWITSTGGQTEALRDWESMWEVNYSLDPADSKVIWVENGDDYSSSYDADTPGDGYCAYLTQFTIYYPQCSGSGTGANPVVVDDYYSTPFVLPDYTGMPITLMPESHGPLAGSYYHQTSGDGPFSWSMAPPDVEIDADDQIQSFRWLMISTTDYACDSANFVNLTYDLNVYFFDFNLLGEGGIWFNQTIESGSNQVTYWKPHSTSGDLETACFIGMDIVLDLDVFQQIDFRDHFNNNYSDMWTVVQLDNIDVEGIAFGGLGSTEMPFLGADPGQPWALSYQYTSTSYSEVTFFVKGGTLILAFAVLAAGLASTPYWDPFRALFRGRF